MSQPQLAGEQVQKKGHVNTRGPPEIGSLNSLRSFFEFLDNGFYIIVDLPVRQSSSVHF
jgi:hypothetical protein